MVLIAGSPGEKNIPSLDGNKNIYIAMGNCTDCNQRLIYQIIPWLFTKCRMFSAILKSP